MTEHCRIEKEIKDAMDKWVTALSCKNIEDMHRDYVENYRLFDVKETINNIQDSKKLWKDCFPFFDTPQIEYKDLVIETTKNMAVATFRSRINGINVPMPEEMMGSWLRGTCCFKKNDGKWKVFHEHISFPVNCENNSIIFEKLDSE